MKSLLLVLWMVAIGLTTAKFALRIVREGNRSKRFGLGLLVAGIAVFASIKTVNREQEELTVNRGQLTVHVEKMTNDLLTVKASLLTIPSWYLALGLSLVDADLDGIPDVWEKRVFSDPHVHDSEDDRDADDLEDIDEFWHGTDPRAASTSGGIITDGWLIANELDPLLVWDDEFYANGVTYLDLFLHGKIPDPLDDTDYPAWWERGLDPDVDEWPEGEDAAGDITRVSIRVTGAAKGSTIVAIGPIRHVGSQTQVYALRSGRTYDVTLTALPGGAGLAGEVEIRPVEGMITRVNDFTHSFTLSANVPQRRGFAVMNAQGNAVPPVETWRLLLTPANDGCIHGRLPLVTQVQKGDAGLVLEEPGRCTWQWKDKDPFGVVRNVTTGVSQVQLSKSMAQKWIDKYGWYSRRELICSFKPEGESVAVVGGVGLACCLASGLKALEEDDNEGTHMGCGCHQHEIVYRHHEYYFGGWLPVLTSVCQVHTHRGCLCHDWDFPLCEHCLQGKTGACAYCYSEMRDDGCHASATFCDCVVGGGYEPVRSTPPPPERPLPWRAGCLFHNNDDDLRLGREDRATTTPSLKMNYTDHDIKDARIGVPQAADCCQCPAHTQDYELKILAIPGEVKLYDASGHEVQAGATFSEWEKLFVEGMNPGGLITPCPVVYREKKDGQGGIRTNHYVVGRVSLFGDVDRNGTLSATDFRAWPHDGWGYIPVALSAFTSQAPTQPLTATEIQFLPRVGLGMWMETQGGGYELRVAGDGKFEVWQNWGGAWQLATKSGDAQPFTFSSGTDIRHVLIRCRAEGVGRLELTYTNAINSTHDNVYGATLLLHGYDQLRLDSDNTNGHDLPDQTEAEAAVKNIPGTPGKIVILNDKDVDHDGIPDYADGFSAKPDADYAQCSGTRFVPVVFTIPPLESASTYGVRILYNASDPTAITWDADGKPILPSGRVRLWKKDGNAARSSTPLLQGGDYIPSTPYTIAATDLGFTDTLRTQTFYLEGIAPSATLGDETITFEVYHISTASIPSHINTARITIVAATMDAIDPQFAPSRENLDFKYTITPATFVAQSVKAEVFMGIGTNRVATPLYTANHLGRSGTVQAAWDGRDDTGAFIMPTNYTVKVSVGVPGYTNAITSATNTAVKVHAVAFGTGGIYDGEKVDMGFTVGELDDSGLTDFHALAQITDKAGNGVATQIPLTVHFTVMEGGSNIVYNSSYEYEPGKFLGKRGDPDAKYWKATAGQSIMAGSTNSFHTTAYGTTITAAGNPDFGKAFMTFQPSGVGGDNFTLNAHVTLTNSTAVLSTTTTNLVVWRKVVFDKIWHMTGETNLLDNATKTIIQPFFTPASGGSTYIDYYLDTSTIFEIDPLKSVEYVGLWINDPAVNYQLDWAVIQRKIDDPHNPVLNETPTQQQWDNAIDAFGTVPNHIRDQARNDIIALAQKWVDRIDHAYRTSRAQWSQENGFPANTMVAIKHNHPKYSQFANAGQTSEWGNHVWLTIITPRIGESVNPDDHWANVGGTSYPNGVVAMPKGFPPDFVRKAVAHEAGHETKHQCKRELFDSSTGTTTDHSPFNSGLMDPRGSQSQFNQREQQILKGEKTK